MSGSILGESRLQLGQGLEGGSGSNSIVSVDDDGLGLLGLGVDLLNLVIPQAYTKPKASVLSREESSSGRGKREKGRTVTGTISDLNLPSF